MTRSGWWALVLFAVTVGSVVALMAFAISGETGGSTIFDNLRLGIPGVLAAVSAVAALAVGAFALIREHERSAADFLVTAISAMACVFILGEFIAPH